VQAGLSSLDYVTLAIRNFHDSGSFHIAQCGCSPGHVVRSARTFAPAATLSGLAATAFTRTAYPEFDTTIAHLQTSPQAAGTAAVLSVNSGAAIVYVREALTTFFDPYSQAASHIYQFISETRLALATPRLSAINLLSGLPTS
jgi:hypothetical protein